MHKYLEKKGEVNFDKIFNQVLGKPSRTSGVAKFLNCVSTSRPFRISLKQSWLASLGAELTQLIGSVCALSEQVVGIYELSA
jgi:hypothetical protein